MISPPDGRVPDFFFQTKIELSGTLQESTDSLFFFKTEKNSNDAKNIGDFFYCKREVKIKAVRWGFQNYRCCCRTCFLYSVWVCFHMSRENWSVQDTSSKTPVSHGPTVIARMFGSELRLETLCRLGFGHSQDVIFFCWRLVAMTCSTLRHCWITFKFRNSYGGWFTKLLQQQQAVSSTSLVGWASLQHQKWQDFSPPKNWPPPTRKKNQKTRWTLPSVKRNSPKLPGQFLSSHFF